MHHDYNFERSYWGDCCNTFDEEQKQYVYARFMGLTRKHYSFDVSGKKILDIGGGPVSLLLKTVNLSHGKVVDPIEYPLWTQKRYALKGIEVEVGLGEDVNEEGWDEVWIYNCLQHAVDPAKILRNARKAAKTLRIFEWIDIPAHDGHPHELSESSLNFWLGLNNGLGKRGYVAQLNEGGCVGKAYYGCFFWNN